MPEDSASGVSKTNNFAAVNKPSKQAGKTGENLSL